MTPESSSQTRIQTAPPHARTPSGSSRQANVIVAGLGSSSGTGLPPNVDNQPTVISKEPPALLPLAMANLPPAEMGRLLLGEKLGHYELQEFVGGGGMGAVFRALDPMLNRVVAVKVLSKVQSDDEETVRRFKNEAQSAARLDHENISRVHYVGEERGWHYIVFEFIEGVNLRDLVQSKGPLPLGEALSYTLQVTDALAHASQRDVVHRDIKPSNVLITPEGRAKLVDMGLARLHQVEHPDHDLTASGVTLGTFDYISPEQARDPRHADVRSDLYSLGCTLYFMLTGRPPFPDGTVLQKLLQHQADEPPDPKAYRADLPDDVCRLLRKLLAKGPQQRYQRPDDLAIDLLALAATHGLTLPAPSAVQFAMADERKPALWMRHLPWLVPVGALCLAAAALALSGPSTAGNLAPPPIRHLPPAAAKTMPGNAASAELPLSSDRDSHVGVGPRTSPGIARSPEESSSGSERETAANSTSDNAATKALGRGDSGKRSNLSKSSTNGEGASATQVGASAGSTPTPGATAEPAGTETPSTAPARGASTVSKSVIDVLTSMRQHLRSLVSGGGSASAITGTKSADGGGAHAAVSASTSPSRAAAATGATGTSPPGERKGLLIVSREAERADSAHEADVGSNEYASLGDACRAAKSGDVIELRYNGRLDEQPIGISNLRLTIRGGDGFAPIVGFQPRAGDPWAQASAMLSLGGSQLTLINTQIELDVPQHVEAERWTLAEIRPGESLRLEGCALTIRNSADSGGAFHPDVAVFNVGAVPGSGVMMPPDAPMIRPPASVQLKNCLVRGEATTVRSNQAQPIQLSWENGLLATTERFLTAGGVPSDPKPQGQIQIELRHVTALVRSGFCRLLNSLDSPQQLRLEITASDCIFICDPASAFVEQSGSDDPEDFRRRISWNGDRNFYERLTTYWRIGAPGSEVAVQMNLHDWQTFWGAKENQPLAGQVLWQAFPPASRSVSTDVPGDFALRAGENPARGAASDGRDAGFQADSLPLFNAVPKPTDKAEPKGGAKSHQTGRPLDMPAKPSLDANANTAAKADDNAGGHATPVPEVPSGATSAIPQGIPPAAPK